MTLMPGKKSSEYSKALRAEVLGVLVLVVGVALALFSGESAVREGAGVALAAVGALLVASTTSSYARSRGDVKSAAVTRRPPEVGQKHL